MEEQDPINLIRTETQVGLAFSDSNVLWIF